jgi:hypothetical protein
MTRPRRMRPTTAVILRAANQNSNSPKYLTPAMLTRTVARRITVTSIDIKNELHEHSRKTVNTLTDA